MRTSALQIINEDKCTSGYKPLESNKSTMHYKFPTVLRLLESQTERVIKHPLASHQDTCSKHVSWY